jgi:hypothetical protein
MRIGAGITIVVIGAIIAFAVRDTSDRVNLTALGIIIMLGGIASIWLSYRIANRTGLRRTPPVLDPEVEKQYSTEPPRKVATEPIDVTPSHLRDQQRH